MDLQYVMVKMIVLGLPMALGGALGIVRLWKGRPMLLKTVGTAVACFAALAAFDLNQPGQYRGMLTFYGGVPAFFLLLASYAVVTGIGHVLRSMFTGKN